MLSAARADAAEEERIEAAEQTSAGTLLLSGCGCASERGGRGRSDGGLLGALLEQLERALAIDVFFIRAEKDRLLDDLLPLGGGDRPDLAARRAHEGALDDGGLSLFIEQ